MPRGHELTSFFRSVTGPTCRAAMICRNWEQKLSPLSTLLVLLFLYELAWHFLQPLGSNKIWSIVSRRTRTSLRNNSILRRSLSWLSNATQLKLHQQLILTSTILCACVGANRVPCQKNAERMYFLLYTLTINA